MTERIFDLSKEPSAASVLRARLNSYLWEEDEVVRGAIVYAQDPDRPLRVLAEKRLDSVEVAWETSFAVGYYVADTCRHQGQDRTFSAPVVEVRTPFAGLSVVLGLGTANFWELVMMRFFRRARAFLATPAVRSKTLHALVEEAARASDSADFEITSLSSVSQIDFEPGGRSRRERVWTRESATEALGLIADRGLSIRGVGFEYSLIGGEYPTHHRGAIKADSTFRARGEYSWLESQFVAPLLREAEHSIGLLRNRARTQENAFAPRPIQIQYEGTPFKDRREFARLAAALDEIPKSSISVQHANPHFRGSLVDFQDGSSYEILVLSLRRILVVPQARATYSSLGRVIDELLVHFGDGDVSDFAAEELSA